MVKNKFRLKNNKLYVYPLSDLHLGSPNCDLEYFKYWCQQFEQNKSKNKIIYLLGDLIDMQSLRIGAWEHDLTANEQVSQIIDLLKPYKKYINYMTTGNHEKRAKKDYNMDVSKLIADILEIPYDKSDFFDSLTINNNEFIIYGRHGNSFSKRLELAEGRFIMDTHNIKADLCMCGHNHYGSYFNRPIRTQTSIKRKYYIFSGHFLEYTNSYAHEKNANHVPQVFLRLNIDKNLVLRCDEYHKDMVWNN